MIKAERALRQEISGVDKILNAGLEHAPGNGVHKKSMVKRECQIIQHVLKSCEVITRATFLNFDVKEWIVENDLLVDRLKENDSQSTVQEVLCDLTSLLERVQGLPPEPSFICYEQAIAYNLSHLLLRGHVNVLVGGLHKSTKILHRSLWRAFEAFKLVRDHQQSAAVAKSEEDLFTPQNIDHTLGTLLPSLFEVLRDKSIGCAPLVLSACLLAFLWLLDDEVSKAVELLQMMPRQLKHLEGENVSSAEEVPDRCSVHLFSLEYIPSITNCVISSSTKDLTDIQNLLSVVTSLLAFAHFTNKDYDKVLETLDRKVTSQDISFNDSYLKGYTLYERSEVVKAYVCFQQCLNISEGEDKAAALNMLGCCCAVKGKHHTAVAKFRDALVHDFQQLEALFNIALQYRKLGNFMAEIQTLKLLKQTIHARKSEQERCFDVAVITSDGSNDQNKKTLDAELTVPPRFALARVMSSSGLTTELVTYMLAKRSAELDRFEDAAKHYLELLANVVDMRTTSFCTAIDLPSPTELYQQCALALFKAGRCEDTVTVCDKVLTTVDSVKLAEKDKGNETRTNMNMSRKRLRSDDEKEVKCSIDEETNEIDMLMLKAEALIQLHQPLAALQSINRVLKALESVQSAVTHSAGHQDSEKNTDGQQRKKRRVDCADNVSTNEENHTSEPNKLVKIKVQAYNQKASILEGLGQTQDALDELFRSLEFSPENPVTVYNHTRLLLKLGQNKEATLNWLRFRGVQLRENKGDLGTIRKVLSSSIVKLLESDVTLEQVQEMDELSLKWLSDEKGDPFNPFGKVL